MKRGELNDELNRLKRELHRLKKLEIETNDMEELADLNVSIIHTLEEMLDIEYFLERGDDNDR